ncbi:biotin/lipoyl-containing protein [Magnetospira sp. QH-2]|uniref:biotin/lipoyl-containing protein n=1 Tax=Magnetospira sp. (strain QH-2) TaxID=1288970 RepID=UPI0003E8169D|nr:acetyl-CoA carboxylase biotin carboxyl carrier protein subunit [Magnetospira sp. QH-2]CCQ74030.1 Putative biotin/lipoyl attachment domain-containing protein [Magnetospira sp. QH-2]
MLKHFRISVDGHPYDVTVEEVNDAGNLYPSPSLTSAAVTAPPPAPEAPSAPSSPAPAADAGPDDKLSPLAGMITGLHVKAGDAVSEGDKICTIEAMKMNTAVTAHKSGTIAAILVAEGDAVDAGQPIMTIT